jgi:hypothetical protein
MNLDRLQGHGETGMRARRLAALLPAVWAPAGRRRLASLLGCSYSELTDAVALILASGGRLCHDEGLVWIVESRAACVEQVDRGERIA